MDPLAELFDRFRADGDVEALGEVFERTAPRLLALATHMCGDLGMAEDALQQTFLAAMSNAAGFDASRPLEPWLAGLLANRIRSLRRTNRRREMQPLTDVESRDADPLAAAERRDLLAQLRRHTEVLAPEQRQVVLLQLDHGLSPVEIAEVLGVAPGTVRMRLHRGLRKLRQLLPAALSGFLASELNAVGLSSVRSAVMAAARRQTIPAGKVASIAAVDSIGGTLVAKKILTVVVAALALASGVVWLQSAPSTPAPVAEVRVDTGGPRTAVSEKRIDQRASSAADRSSVLRAPVADNAVAGSLTVRLRAVIDGEEADWPVAGTVLRVWPGGTLEPPLDGAGERVMRTNSSGVCHFLELPAGPWNVLDAASRSAKPEQVDLLPGEDTRLELTRPTVGVVHGRVIDETGATVADAEIWLSRGSLHVMGPLGIGEPVEQRLRLGAVSDSNGDFAVACSADESTLGTIAASKAGYAASRGRSLLRDEVLDLVLHREFTTVDGVVLDEDGRPAGDVLVMLRPSGQDSRRGDDGSLLKPRLTQLQRTDGEGRFLFDGLPIGTHRVWATAPWTPGAWRNVTLSAPFARTSVELRLGAGVVVHGMVLRGDGAPAHDVVVFARPDRDATGHFAHCDTRDDGSFVLEHLSRRSFSLVVEHRRQRLLTVDVRDPDRRELRPTLRLPSRPVLHGRLLTTSDQALVGWRVVAVNPEGSRRSCVTDDRGRFELPYLDAGSVRLEVVPPDGDNKRPVVSREGVRTGTGSVELLVPEDALPSAAVRGVLVDADGTPVAGASLAVSRPWRSWKYLPEEARVASSEDGVFHIGRLSAGPVELMLQRRKSEDWTMLRDLELAEGESRDLGAVVLDAQARLRVELNDEMGEVWRSTSPTLTLLDGSGARLEVAWHPRAGGQEAWLAPGRYRVQMRGTDVLTVEKDVVVAAGQDNAVRFVVEIGRTRQLVFNGDGDASVGHDQELHVRVHDEHGELVVERDGVTPWPDLRGFRYWLVEHAFRPGVYHVTAEAEPDVRYSAAIRVDLGVEAPSRNEVPRVDR